MDRQKNSNDIVALVLLTLYSNNVLIIVRLNIPYVAGKLVVCSYGGLKGSKKHQAKTNHLHVVNDEYFTTNEGNGKDFNFYPEFYIRILFYEPFLITLHINTLFTKHISKDIRI